jgi:hypothetical protein
MERSKDQYILLSSHLFATGCPENRSNDFRNYLPEPLYLDNVIQSIGLCELTFEQQEQIEEQVEYDNPIEETVQQQPTKLFGHSKDDNKIIIWKYTDVVFGIENSSKNTAELLIILNNQFREYNLDIQFLELRKLEGKTTLRFTDKEKRRLVLPAELSVALGFSTNKFAPGEYESNDFQNYQLYENISKESFLNFKLYTWAKLLHEVDEPDEANYDSAIVFVANTLSENGYNISFDERDTLLIVNIEEIGLKMQLPAAINRILGLPEDFVFHTQRTEIIRPEEKLPDLIPASKSKPAAVYNKSQFVYVICDAIGPQVVGEKSLSIIRALQYTT